METNTLQHHGILGQKWGVRRFQNKDGTLTSAGRKRLAKLESETEKLKGSTTKTHTKSISEMSDDELRQKIARRKLESEYIATTQVVSRGKAITDRVLKNIITPAAEDVGKQVVKSYMAKATNKVLGLEGEDKVYANNKKKN